MDNKWIHDQINNKWYHNNDKDGTRDLGWFQTATDNDNWFYSYPDSGAAATGFFKVDTNYYYAYPTSIITDKGPHYSCEVATGWVNIEDKWYYFCPSETTSYGINYPKCAMIVDWFKIDGEWYYLIPDKLEYNSNTHYMGEMVADTTVTINGISATFDKDGKWQGVSTGGVSDKGIDFIKSFEGFPEEGRKYYDCVGVLTQGYGMTGAEIVNLPDQISEETAAAMLQDWVDVKYAPVVAASLKNAGITTSQNEFDALVSFAYNCGTAALLGSTLFKNILKGVSAAETITSNFEAWCKGTVDGVSTTIPGLLKRRQCEAALFLNADYTGNN